MWSQKTLNMKISKAHYDCANDGFFRHRFEYPLQLGAQIKGKQAKCRADDLIKSATLPAAFAKMYSIGNTLGTILKHIEKIHSIKWEETIEMNPKKLMVLKYSILKTVNILKNISEGLYKEDEAKKIEKDGNH